MNIVVDREKKNTSPNKSCTFSLSELLSLDSVSCSLCSSLSMASVNTAPCFSPLHSEPPSSTDTASPPQLLSSLSPTDAGLLLRSVVEQEEGGSSGVVLMSAEAVGFPLYMSSSVGASPSVERVLAPSGSEGDGFLEPVAVSLSVTISICQ